MVLQCHMPRATAPTQLAHTRLRAALPWLGSVAAHAIVIFSVGLGAHRASDTPPTPPIDIVLQATPDTRAAPAAAQPQKPAPTSPSAAKPVAQSVVTAPKAAEPPALMTSTAAATADVVAVAAPQPAVSPAPQVASPAAAKPATAPTPAPARLIHADVNTAYLQNPAPSYPTMSRKLGESGTVTLWVAVNAGGTVDDLGVLRSSGYARLDTEALKSVKQWRFNPAKRGGEAVADKVSVPIEFAL